MKTFKIELSLWAVLYDMVSSEDIYENVLSNNDTCEFFRVSPTYDEADDVYYEKYFVKCENKPNDMPLRGVKFVEHNT